MIGAWKMVSIHGGGLNPGPLSHESSTFTTRPRLLASLGFVCFKSSSAYVSTKIIRPDKRWQSLTTKMFFWPIKAKVKRTIKCQDTLVICKQNTTICLEKDFSAPENLKGNKMKYFRVNGTIKSMAICLILFLDGLVLFKLNLGQKKLSSYIFWRLKLCLYFFNAFKKTNFNLKFLSPINLLNPGIKDSDFYLLKFFWWYLKARITSLP